MWPPRYGHRETQTETGTCPRRVPAASFDHAQDKGAAGLNEEGKRQSSEHTRGAKGLSKLSGQAERAISTGRLHVLLRFHVPPINQVVFLGPSYPSACAEELGDLILGRASRLDAFSDYPCLTSLPCDAAGATTGTQEVSPSRSSRTRDRPPQISYAHTR